MPVNYNQYIPDAYKRYMANIFGESSEKGYVSSQVGGVSAGMQPYMNQMSKQTAGNLGARGGLGSGSQDVALSKLLSSKILALQQAGSSAQKDVLNTKTHAMGMAQNEAFKLSDDQMQQLLLGLKKKGMLSQFIGDLLGAGGIAAGMALAPATGGASMALPAMTGRRPTPWG